uniref:Uncharacterized protein LOC111124124 n=1 Tax=Crassostrea virginica TaxID=6565 RepID=A0A8B8D771_CRAVI|nr:uncharacterized protein LOC111124124 [Crassostrea virginica]
METSHRVSHCPQDRKEWQKASHRLNCSDDDTNSVNKYHCLPIDTKTTLLEFCYNRTRAQVTKGLCMVYVGEKNIVNHYNCSKFKEGCPNTVYYSNEMYKFPACFEIEPTQHCYKAEASCLPTTSSPTAETFDRIYYLLAAIIFVIALITFIIAWKYRRRMRRCFDHKETKQTPDYFNLEEANIEADIDEYGIDYLLEQLPNNQNLFPIIAKKRKDQTI